MKIKLLLVIFALSGIMLHAQEVLLQGNIATVASGFQPASTTAAFYKFVDSLGKDHIAAMPVNHLGQFRKTLPANTDIQLYIYYNDFVPIDTVLNTGEGPVLSLRFMLISKTMQFSAATAQEDIEGQKVRIIFHDAQMARLFQKAGFKDKYGFIFSYIPRPDSWEDLRDISEYNAVMESYLDNLNPSGWRDQLYAEMDSLIEIRESFAGLANDEEKDDETVFLEVPEKQSSTQPIDSEVADVFAIPKEVSIDSEPVQRADSLDLPKPLYLALDPKDPIKGFELESGGEEPDVKMPFTSESPAITTESNPVIFIPIKKDTISAPLAMEEVETPVADMEDILTAKGSDDTISGPSATGLEGASAAIVDTETSFEEIEEDPIAMEPETEIDSEPLAEADDVDTEVLEEIVEEDFLADAIANEDLTTEIEELETVSSNRGLDTETVAVEEDDITEVEQLEVPNTEPETPVAESVAFNEVEEVKTETDAGTSLNEIISQTEKDPNLIPGIHIAALPMTPPPPREEEQTAANKVQYQGGSIVEYFDAMQTDALDNAVAESERLYGNQWQSSLPKSWRFPHNAYLNPIMESRLAENREMFENYYIPRLKWQTDAPVAFMLRRIDKDPNYRSVEIIKYWSALHYEALIPELILRITYTEIVGLKDYRDIIIWDRVDNGDMILDGPGADIEDDLFSVAGRANYLLKNLTGEDFGDLGMYTSNEERLAIRDHWVNWLLSLENGQSFVSP